MFSKCLMAAFALILSLGIAPTAEAVTTGPQRLVVIRVRFHDYSNTSRYSRATVQGFFDSELNQLWGNVSYGTISIDGRVTDLFQLPSNRSEYITNHSDGDLSEGGQYMKVLNDAVQVARDNSVDFNGASMVYVLMAETSTSHYHRGQGNKCNLKIGAGGKERLVGCAIFSENPSDPDRKVWGRWAHEIGHTLQEGGPAHPSNYNSNFELMDALYPGQSGMFEKQANTGFPGWMPPSKYKLILSTSQGDTGVVTAEEFNPASVVEYQALKIQFSSDLYYLVSARRRFNGDELNPIPDEGVLIERVVVGGDPWVTIQGKGGNRDTLWQSGDYYYNSNDRVGIDVVVQLDPNTWLINVRLGDTAAPDVMLRPWLSPPLHTYETTDIWIDSSCNGYGTYQYGTLIPPGDSTSVGKGNGDNPCANHENRVYARVRNIGTQTASVANVRFEAADPLGVGIMGAAAWSGFGVATPAQFPGLASIAPGAYVDVYALWTPSLALSPSQKGNFDFHSCVRVRIDPVAGEKNTANNNAQENVAHFYAGPSLGPPDQAIDYVIHLKNDSPSQPKSFNLFFDTDMPDEWQIELNGGARAVDLGPNEMRDIPVRITPGGPRAVGERYELKIGADSLSSLVNDLDPSDIHNVYTELSGATIEVRIASPVALQFRPHVDGRHLTVDGLLEGAPEQSAVMLEQFDASRNLLSSTLTFTASGGQLATGMLLEDGATMIAATYGGAETIQSVYVEVPLP